MMNTMSLPLDPQLERCSSFVAGDTGQWQIERVHPVIGESLCPAGYLDVQAGYVGALPSGASWLLRGVVSNARYTTRDEQEQLAAVQPTLGRPEARCAALIPISKNAAWWELSQDQRRGIMERGMHLVTGLRYLPAIARRLHHGRDLGEPFDFLTWFEYAPEHSSAFEELVSALRDTEEWGYVSREVDVRLRLIT